MSTSQVTNITKNAMSQFTTLQHATKGGEDCTTIENNGVDSNHRKISFGGNTENKNPDAGIKKYLSVPNVLLGSLATLGAFGIADVLLCKGKHINKLTGTSKQITKTTDSLKEAEEIILKKDKRIKEREETINSLLEKNKTYTKEISSKDDRINDLEDALENKKLENTRINKELRSLKADCQELKVALKCTEFELEEMRSKSM